MILLTGVNGFIGKKLLDFCINKYGKENVVAFSSRDNEKCRTILYKNHDFDSTAFLDAGLDSIKSVIHVGAFTPKKKSESNDILNCNSNIYFTQKLLLSIPKSVEKFIFLSTLDVYGSSNRPIIEMQSANPNTLYGFSKLYCEKMVEQWAVENNKIIQILRLGHVYGPGESLYQKIIPVTMQKIMKNEQPIILGDGSAKRAFIYIDDVVFCINEFLKFNDYKGPVNIVNDQFVTIQNIVDQIIQVAGVNFSPEYRPQELGNNDLFFDATKLKSLINVEFTPLQIGLKKEWDSMIKQTK